MYVIDLIKLDKFDKQWKCNKSKQNRATQICREESRFMVLEIVEVTKKGTRSWLSWTIYAIFQGLRLIQDFLSLRLFKLCSWRLLLTNNKYSYGICVKERRLYCLLNVWLHTVLLYLLSIHRIREYTTYAASSHIVGCTTYWIFSNNRFRSFVTSITCELNFF